MLDNLFRFIIGAIIVGIFLFIVGLVLTFFAYVVGGIIAIVLIVIFIKLCVGIGGTIFK